MTTDDELLAKLPRAARDAFEHALAVPREDHVKRNAWTAKAWDAVAIPKGDAGFPVHSLPTEFDDVQRAALEFSARNELGAFPYACPASSKTLRAWLGLEPGILETHLVDGEPLWRALQKAGNVDAQVRILNALPLELALRALGALCTTAYGYGFNRSLFLPHGHLRVLRDLKHEGRDWAIAQADAMTDVPAWGSSLRAFVFLALVRAKVPIEPRWDWLYPSLPGVSKELLFECARAIPEERRAAAIGPHLRSIPWAIEMIAEFPSAAMARAVFEGDEPNSPRFLFNVRELRKLGDKHPEIAAVVKSIVDAAPKPIELRVTRLVTPAGTSELTPLEREQLRIGVRGLEEDLPVEERLTSADGETPFIADLQIRNIADANGKPLYDAFTYAADRGVIFVAGTTEEFGWRVQGGVQLKERDHALRNALQIAVHSAPIKAKARATKKPAK